MTYVSTKIRRIGIPLFVALCLSGIEVAQNSAQPVRWAGSVAGQTPIRQGSKVGVDLAATLEDGWHVYGFEEAAGGPTALHVALEENEVLQSVGPASGSPPVKKHDASFDLETEFYAKSFTVRLPVQVKQHSSIGKQVISVSVRFQACNDRICLPPRTIHVSVPFEVVPTS
jgi:DsbC/DsbD-like thiol-disulfide interchange protein